MENKDINFDQELHEVPLVPTLKEAADREAALERYLKATHQWRSPTKKYATKAQRKNKRKMQKSSRRRNRK